MPIYAVWIDGNTVIGRPRSDSGSFTDDLQIRTLVRRWASSTAHGDHDERARVATLDGAYREFSEALVSAALQLGIPGTPPRDPTRKAFARNPLHMVANTQLTGNGGAHWWNWSLAVEASAVLIGQNRTQRLHHRRAMDEGGPA